MKTAAPATGAPPAAARDAAGPRRWVVPAGLAALFVAAAVVMTFPAVDLWRTAVPGDYGDAFLYQYLLRWDVHSLFGGGGRVFDAPFYWPHESTLLYSDTVLGVAPVAGLIAAISDWVVAFNLVYLAGWVASLACTFGLSRWLGASRAGSVLAAFVFTFAAVRLGHYGHFQLGFAFFIPLTLWLLLLVLAEHRWWQAVALGLSATAVFLNSGYLTVALFPALAVVGLGWIVASRFRPGWRSMAAVAAAGTLALVLSWPVLSAYAAIGNFLRRPYLPEEAISLRSFLAPASGSLIYGWLERWAGMSFEKRLFPGFAALALAAVGAWSLFTGRSRESPRARRRRAPRRADVRRRGLVLVVVSTVPPLLLAFGTSQEILGVRVTMPYAWVDTLPGFQTIRAFGRFAVVPLLAVALLAAAGYDRLVRARSRGVALGAAVVLGAFMLVEYRARIILSHRVDQPRFVAVNHALSRLPDAAVAELPMGEGTAWAFVEAPRMVLSAIDWKPRVGGYSGYAPPRHDHTVRLLNSLADGGPASPEVLDLIDRLGIGYLVIRLAPVDRSWAQPGRTYADPGMAQAIVRALPPERLDGVTREGAALLVRLRPPTRP